MERVIKALSLWQPWASAIAVGAKRIETRHWKTDYRGPLLIHAAREDRGLRLRKRTRPGGESEMIWRAGGAALRAAGLPDDHNACTQLAARTCGAIIAVADLVDCLSTSRTGFQTMCSIAYCGVLSPNIINREVQLGDFSVHRYGWLLDNVRALPQPLPFTGRQGLFNVPVSLLPEEFRP